MNKIDHLVQQSKDAEEWKKFSAVLKNKPTDFIYRDDVIAALRVLMKCGVARSYSSLVSLIEEVDRVKSKLNEIKNDLGIEKEK